MGNYYTLNVDEIVRDMRDSKTHAVLRHELHNMDADIRYTLVYAYLRRYIVIHGAKILATEICKRLEATTPEQFWSTFEMIADILLVLDDIWFEETAD